MNIVDSSVDDITLEEAARMAGRSAKTLRRAVQSGIFPRRYVIGLRGPQLVFNRGDLEHWLSGRMVKARVQRRKRREDTAADQPDWPDFLVRVANLQTALNENNAGILQLAAALRDQAAAMSTAEAALAHLTLKVDELEAHVIAESMDAVQRPRESSSASHSRQRTSRA